MRIVSLLTLILATMFGAWANPSVKLTYCTEIEDGYGDSGGSITPWVAFGTDKTDMYAGSQVVAVRIGLNSKANNVTIYLKHTPEDADAFYTQKVGTLEAGWHEITLDTPYELEKGKPLAVGYKATFTKAKGAGYSLEHNVNASRAFYNTKSNWIDIKGAFCIEAIVEGAELIQNEMGIISATNGVKGFHDTSTAISATVENLGSNDVTSFSLTYSVDGGEATEVDFESAIAPGERTTVQLDIPEAGIGIHSVKVCIAKVNGEPDAYEANNSITVTVTERDPSFMRRVVVEEVTGDWCGWCPRGIVGLEMMEKKYPDQFIGFAVHSGDAYETASYKPTTSKILSLPGSFVDRRRTGDPYYEIESNVVTELSEICHVGYEMKAALEDNTITVTSIIRVDRETQASTLNSAFTLLEDDLMGVQSNYFSGGDTEMDGWELLDPYVLYYYKDVARGIFPSYNGEAMLEGTLVPGEDYEFTYSFELPDYIQDKTKLHVVGQVIDAGNGFILNADKAAPMAAGSSVESIETDAAEVLSTELYTIDGLRLTQPLTELPAGIYIEVTRLSDGTHTSRKLHR